MLMVDNIGYSCPIISSPCDIGYPCPTIPSPCDLGYPCPTILSPCDIGYPCPTILSPCDIGNPCPTILSPCDIGYPCLLFYLPVIQVIPALLFYLPAGGSYAAIFILVSRASSNNQVLFINILLQTIRFLLQQLLHISVGVIQNVGNNSFPLFRFRLFSFLICDRIL